MVLEAAAGYRYNCIQNSIQFAPVLSSDNFSSFFITANSWGNYSQTGDNKMSSGSFSLSVANGTLALQQITIASTATSATVTLGNQPVDAQVSQNNGMLTISFSLLQTQAGTALKAVLS